MSHEKDSGYYHDGMQRFAVPKSTDRITVYPIQNPEDDRIDDELQIKFALACFPEDDSGELFSIVPFTSGNSQMFYYRIVEIECFDREKGAELVNIDGWLDATKKSILEGTPVFAISFGIFKSDNTPGVYLHVRKGVNPNRAFYYLDEFAQDKLLGIE